MELRFPAYRRYDRSRIRANDTAMAVLASIRVTQTDLASRDQDTFLPTAFDSEPDVRRLNLRIRDALHVIDDAERSLAYLAIPFVLSVYHAYGADCLRMVAGVEADESSEVESGLVELNDLHIRFVEATGSDLPADLLGLFDLLRAVRNRITHYAGIRGSYLNQKWRSLPAAARDGWRNVAGRDFPTGPTNEELALGTGELIGALMVVTRLGREMNSVLALAIPRDRWASIAAADFRTMNPTRFAQRDVRLRRFRGFAREHYAELGFSDEELSLALQTLDAKRPGP